MTENSIIFINKLQQEVLRTTTTTTTGVDLLQLSKREPIKACVAILFNWAIVLALLALTSYVFSWESSFISTIWFVTSVFAYGCLQHRLNNLLHASSHSSFLDNCTISDLFVLSKHRKRDTNQRSSSPTIIDFFLAYAMFNTYCNYRNSHHTHHKHLGTRDDPDHGFGNLTSLNHYRKLDLTSPFPIDSVYKKYIQNVSDFTTWKGNAFGSFFDLPMESKRNITIWWSLFLFVIFSLSSSYRVVLFFVTSWLFARATVYHFIGVFREMCDHTGLQPGTTRNSPTNGLLREILSPYDDTYHLIHHLYPNISFWNMKKAHKHLWETSKLYKESCHHCDGYFFGRHSVVDCMVGKCNVRPGWRIQDQQS